MARVDKHTPQEHRPEPAGKTARRRWPWWLSAVLFCCALLIWFTPGLVARTRFAPSFLSAVAAKLDGRVSVGSASLGWLSPVVFRDVEARDGQDQPLLEVAELRSEKSLLSLLYDHRRLGVLLADQPRLFWVGQPFQENEGDKGHVRSGSGG